jgi:hypothetical protein
LHRLSSVCRGDKSTIYSLYCGQRSFLFGRYVMRAQLRDWRWFKWHLVAYCIGITSALWIARNSEDTSWFSIGWTLFVGFHLLVVKTLNVDDDWGETRAYKLRNKTYDHKHIDQIVDSAVDSVPTEDPAAPRRH